MVKVKYTKEQIVELLKNKHIKNCTNKNISFSKEFKLELIKGQKCFLNTIVKNTEYYQN